jgi:hypothetical protein
MRSGCCVDTGSLAAGHNRYDFRPGGVGAEELEEAIQARLHYPWPKLQDRANRVLFDAHSMEGW